MKRFILGSLALVATAFVTLAATPVQAAPKISHLNQAIEDHVVLLGSSNTKRVCLDDFRRVLPDGTLQELRRGQPLIPEGRVMVVTDIDWTLVESSAPEDTPPHSPADLATFVLYDRVPGPDPVGPVMVPLYQAETRHPLQSGGVVITSGNASLTAGFEIDHPNFDVCGEVELLGGQVDTTTYKQTTVILRGYFIDAPK